MQIQTRSFQAFQQTPKPDKPEPPQKPEGNFFSNYADNVSVNFEERGVGGTLLHAGAKAFVGGLAGTVGGWMAGIFIPGPTGKLFGMIGAAGGLAWGLQDRK